MAAVRRICRLVQGYPLAIKMLARWANFFGHEEVALRLAQQVPAGVSSVRQEDSGIESSPMQAVFGFLWTLLAEHDRRCIGNLARFRGGFPADAALDVAGASPFLLAALGDRGFVQTGPTGRYYLHELLRQYAWSWLQQDTAADAEGRRRHATWYMGLAEKSAADMRGPHFRQWVERLEAEIDNLRIALTWALDTEPLVALDAALDLTEFWLAGFYAREGRSWIEMALARAEARSDGMSASLRMQALGRLGRLERHCGDTDSARAHATAALALAEREGVGSDRERAYNLSTLANVDSDVQAHGSAVDLARQALQCSRRLGSPRDIALTANLAVWPLIFAGEVAEATGVAAEGVQASRTCGDHRSTANLTNAQATIAYFDPARHDEAIVLYQRAVELYEELYDWSGLLLACNNLASVYLDDGQIELAAQSFADARRIGQRLSQHRMMANVLSGSGMVASIRGDDAAAWGFWREAIELALASDNIIVLEELAIGLAYVWARAGFPEHAAVLIGMVGLQPAGKPWLRLPTERASGAVRPKVRVKRWETLLAHGARLDVATIARLLLSLAGPHEVPERLLPDTATERIY
jgi:tetratricopeptide (TPR) repeat protein